jgi:AcrR family transcriptional regulator
MPEALLQKLSPVVMDIYAAGDFHRADMRTIARESGTSFRTIYKYFRDKEQLLFWFISHWLKGLYPQALLPLNDPGPVRPKLLQVLRRHFEFYERQPQVGRIIFMTVPLAQWMKEPSYSQLEYMTLLLNAMRAAQASGELRKDLPTVAILDAFNAMFNRTFLMWEYRGRSYGLAEQAEIVLKLLWDGIGEDATPRVAKPSTPRRILPDKQRP